MTPFTPAEDWQLWSGLTAQDSLTSIARALNRPACDVSARFHAITDPHKINGMVPESAQAEIARVLRGRLN